MDYVIEASGDLWGAPLDVRLLREARVVETEFFSKMGVWAEK